MQLLTTLAELNDPERGELVERLQFKDGFPVPPRNVCLGGWIVRGGVGWQNSSRALVEKRMFLRVLLLQTLMMKGVTTPYQVFSCS